FVYSVPLALIAMGLTAIFVAFTFAMNFAQIRLQRQQLQLNGKIASLVLQLLNGVSKLRTSGAENHAFYTWSIDFAKVRRLSFRIGTIQNFVVTFNSAFPVLASMAIFSGLVFLTGGKEATTPGMTTGEFIAFNAAFGAFMAASLALSDASLNLLRALPLYERLKPIITTPAEVDENKDDPGELTGEIELSHVHFRYDPDGPWIIKDVSLKIRPGEFVAFVGGSGCGKSTLMRLTVGFETPEKGSVYFDGKELSTLDIRGVRQQMGVVLQDSQVLPVDIFRNIVGTSSLTEEDAWEAARKVGLDKDIKMMPMGMHTYVMEGGGGFSGGQIQRLLLARAVVHNPRIMLLDEATSALDNKTQAIVTESMNRMQATRIAIAHRLSTIVDADTIYVLDKGEVAEAGSYDELMELDGLFASLAKRQIA
ncbi:MAG: ATP-binding cassette domain-containing protein, partial [Pseudomonadota bacterium]